MKLSRTQLAEVIAKRSMNAKEIAAYLLAEGRVAELDSLMRDVMQYRADRGIVEVVAVNAHPLSTDSRKQIESVVRELFPKAKTVIISEEIDAAALGGVKLEFANQQLDLSLRAKLNQFKQLTLAPGGN